MSDPVIDNFREQAGWCTAYGSPFTGQLLERMAQDIEAGGPVAAYVRDWPGHPRADALSLRFAGALHAAAMSGRAPALAARYPAADPHWDMQRVWPEARAYLEQDGDWTRSFLAWPPQTNEVRRSIALLLGFLTIAARFGPVLDTLELGASAGLNLNWDRFSYATSSWRWGGESPVVIDTDWSGPPPPIGAPVQVRARAACDQNPLDIADPTQRLRLRSYVWADQEDRLARFDGAVALALEEKVHVDRADAGDWLEQKLAARAADAPTVVYHSVFLQYPTHETQARIAALMAAAGRQGRAPLIWLRLEPETLLDRVPDSPRFLIDITVWNGGEGTREILGVTDGHVRHVQNGV